MGGYPGRKAGRAFGALHACWDLGLRVPGDVAVVSMGGTPGGQVHDPAAHHRCGWATRPLGVSALTRLHRRDEYTHF